MLRRLLSLLCLFVLTRASAAQQSRIARHDDVPETCPVTKPYQTSLFVPPLPYAPKAPLGYFWFGTNRLWTMLPVNGTWEGLPHYYIGLYPKMAG